MSTGFQNISDIISAQTNIQYAQNIFFYKDPRVGNAAAVASVAGNYTSLWQYNGSPSSGTNVVPTTAAICHRTTAGSLSQTDPISGNLYCVGIVATVAGSAAATGAGTLIIYDRLCHMGGLSGTTLGNQIVSASASTRYTGSMSAGNQIYVNIYTAIGNAVRINATYINQDGITMITPSASFGGVGLKEVDRVINLPLASGDTGVQTVNSIILSATTVTAGNFGVFIGHPIVVVPLAIPCIASVRDTIFGVPSLPQIFPDACLAMLWLANSTAIPQLYGELRLVEK